MPANEFDAARASDLRAEIDQRCDQMNRRGWDAPGSTLNPLTRFVRLCETVREWTFFAQVADGTRIDFAATDLFPWEGGRNALAA